MSITCDGSSPSSRSSMRGVLLRNRLAISEASHRQKSDDICSALHTDISAFIGAHHSQASELVIAVYWPFRGEPALRPLFSRWQSDGLTLALPITPAKPGPLRFARWAAHTHLQSDRMGIHVPASPEWLRPDIMIIPCVGYTHDAYRLGYGGGYYDRTLALQAAHTFGVAFDESCLTGFHAQAHDRALDCIITDRTRYHARQQDQV